MASKFYFAVFIWLCSFFDISAQVWPKYYGQPNRKERAQDIIETYDNGYLILGSYPQFSWLIKTDINGNILWEKIIDNEPNPVGTATALATSGDGGILVCGIALSGFSNKYCPFVMKLNACGEKEWCKIFEGSPNAFPVATDIKETDNGDIVVLVKMFGSSPQETIHLFKLNAYGDVLWNEAYATMHSYPNTNTKSGESLLITNDGKYLISGDAYWEQPWNPGGAMPLTPLFVMVDSSGNEEWVLPFGLNDTIIGSNYSTININDNILIGVGTNRKSGRKGLLMKVDNAGNKLGDNTFDFANFSSTYNLGLFIDIIKYDSLIVLASGIASSSSPYTAYPGELLIDTLTFSESLNVINSILYLGNLEPYSVNRSINNKYLSTSTFRHSSTNYDIFLAKLNLNLEYDTAYTLPITYDSLCTSGPPQSGFIYLNNCDIVTGIDMPTPAEYRARISSIPITIYPNPANENITFALENTEHHRNIELRCFNLLGALQHQTKILRGQQQTTANVSNWPPGMYIAVVYSDGKPVGRGKFVVQR